MSGEPDSKDGAAEPSMEDILASIRRILSDDAPGEMASAGAAAGDAAAAPAPADAPRPAEAPRPAAAGPATAKPAASPFDDDTTRPGSVEPLRPRRDNVFLLTPEMRVAAPHLAAPHLAAVRPPPATTPSAAELDAVLSRRAAASGTDVLSQLASAILDRRDIVVANRDVTLEGMVREMLRPLLREWLDRNLPYLIERLVKREIDLMVNRAERLED
jgi:cell pole-organizing protein PopZ